MFKKILSLIIIGNLLFPSLALAAETPEWQKEFKANKTIRPCKIPKYEEVELEDPDIALKFRVAFEKAGRQYHDFIGCIFEKVTDNMISRVGGSTVGLFNLITGGGTRGDFSASIPEFLKPDISCVEGKNFVEALKAGSPESLVKITYSGAYLDYKAYLTKLDEEISGKVIVETDNISIAEEKKDFMNLLVKNELEDSLVALDTALTMLKEFRMAYVMHIHLMCMVRNLEFLRKVLENLRAVVSTLPPTFHDASTHK